MSTLPTCLCIGADAARHGTINDAKHSQSEVQWPTFMGIDQFRSKDDKKDRNEKKRIPFDRLEKARSEVEHITDGLNLSIDEGIREAVAVFRALNIETTQSCEGHLDHGSPSPYIDFEAPNQPRYRFQNEKQKLESLASKHVITPNEITAWPHDEARRLRAENAHTEWNTWIAAQAEEASDYKAWKEINQRYRRAIKRLIREFYSGRPKPDEGQLLLEHGRLRTASKLYDKFLRNALDREQTGLLHTDRERLRIFLPIAQAEMQAFIALLKSKFFDLDVHS